MRFGAAVYPRQDGEICQCSDFGDEREQRGGCFGARDDDGEEDLEDLLGDS